MRSSILGYLRNGSDCDPFGDRKNNSLPSQGPFVPYSNERDHIGKLVNETDRRQIKKKLAKFSTCHTHSLPYLNTQTSSKFRTEVDTPKYDPVTNYITLLSNVNHSNNKNINTDSYTLNMNQIEKGLGLQNKKNHKDQKFLLISKRSKDLVVQTPALGVYDPQSIERHQPNIYIKSKKTVKQEQQIIVPFKPNTPIKRKINNDFEQMYARQITQINREVEQDIRRNPNQMLHPNKELEMIASMDIEEAENLRSRMKNHFQYMKDSLNKIKALINIKR